MERFLFYRKTCDGFTRKLWLLALLLLWGWGAKAQCPTGVVTLYSQADVNNFATNYPNCTEITGFLYISGSTITDLSPLSNIQSVGGYLEIYNSQLTNLDGLSNLTQIGGYLEISSNSQLTNLDGLSNLTSVGGYLEIYYNSNLTNLDGLSNLTSVGADLVINSNYSLTDISGLQNIDPNSILSSYFGLGLYIKSNSSLSVCNLPNFCTYLQGSGLRTISGNAGDCVSVTAVTTACTTSSEPQCPTGDVMLYSQAAVDAFAVNYPNCTQISGHLLIGALGGTDIVNLEGLSNVTSVGDFLLIGSNHALTTLDGLNNLTSVGGYLSIGSNNVLTTLDGLSNLTSVGGNLLIGYTSLITTLDGLSNLESINGTLEISINATLTDISGLENIDPSTISGLTIINNANLSVCNIANFCTYLSNPDNPRAISDNAGDCISEAAVTTACIPACDAPTNLTATNITSVSATLGWTSTGNNFDIEWGPQGFTQGSGTTVTDIATNSYNLTSLSSNTQYQFYVRQDCTLNESDWVGPFAFTTLSQCPTGDVILGSQAEVDAFAINYPNCTEITGYLYIVGSDITDLSPLSNLTQIGGYLNIYNNSQLTNLDGLSNLTQIGGYLFIYNNSQLTNLDGLSNLTQIGGNLYIYNNYQLTNLDGLSNLTQIGGALYIEANSLTNLDGLSALESINGDLGIYNNAVLTDISGLQNIDPATILPTNGLGLYILNNPLLSVCNMDNFCTYLAGSGPRTISGNAGDCVSEAAVNAACSPACETPTNLSTSNVTSVSATLGWTSDGSLFDVEWGVAGFTQGSGTTVTDITTNSYNLTSLSSNTQYQFYVRQDCTLNQSDWVGPFAFTTLSQCPTGDVILGSQAEVDAFAINYPNCTEITGGVEISGSNITNLDGLSNLTSVGVALRILYNQNLTNLDGLSNLTSVGGQLYFASNNSLTNLAGLNNLTSIGGNVMFWATRFTNLDELNNLTSVGGELGFISNNSLTSIEGLSNLTSIGGGIGFAYNNSLTNLTGLQNIDPNSISGQLGLHIIDNPLLSVCNLPNFCTYLHGSGPRTISGNAEDCISEEALLAICPPTCDAPTDLSADNITYHSATLVWESQGESFEVVWGAAGFDPEEATAITDITTTSYTISEGLDANTQYDFYVRRDCTDLQSDWAGPFEFTTLLQCPTGDIEFFSQADVDAFALAYPNCGHIEGDLYISGNTISDLSSLVNLETVEGSLIVNNTQLTSLEGFNNLESVGNYLSIFENPFLTNLNDLNGLTSVYNLQIYNNNALTDISGLQNLDSNVLGGDYGLYIINNINLSVCNLPNFCAYLSNPNKPRTISGNAGGCLNELAVMVECLPCDTPESLSVQNITSASAKLNWSGTGDYVIEWGEQGFTQGSGTTVTDISDSFYELTNLNSSTSYQFYVRCKLQPNNWVGPVSFYTPLQCPIANDNIGGYSLTTQAAVDAFAVNYPNCTNIPMSLSIQTGNIELTSTDITNLDGLSHVISIQGQLQILSNGNLVDIDGLSNLTNIGGKLYIYYNALTNLDALSNLESINGAVEIRSNASLIDISGLENIDPSTISGLTIINNANLSVCNIANFCTYLSNPDNPRTISGNAANCISVAAVNVACAPACEAPTNLTATNMTINSATLSWTSDGSLFDIEWGIEGFTQGSGAVVNNITTTTYTLSGVLSPDTTYEFYVLKNCTVNQSDWVGPFTFMTLPLPTCATPTDLAVTDITTSSATLNWESDGASFEVVWVSPGFNPEAATPITNITTTSYTISEGLDANTQYDFYVRQNCTEDEIVSDWVGPYEFTTSAILCPEGDVSLNTQVDVDAFLVQYPNCTQIDGTLQIGGVGSTINNLDGFSNIESIAGALLVLNNWDLENLDGLSSLITVIGHLQITNNFTLTDIDGLSNLTSLGADITIAYNDNLTSVSGLSGLTTINPVHNEGLRLFGNMSLTTCEIELFCYYLSQDSETHPREIYNNGANCNDEAEIYAACNPPVACSEGDIDISSQQDLDLYVANYPLCTIINGSLFIEDTDISDLSGLNNIETITGDVYITANQQLTSLNGLTSLETIGGMLYIGFNSSMQDLDGLYSLRTIEGMLSIDSNPLQNLNGLNALESIGDELMIALTGLSNLDGLSNLTHLGADISIMYNDYLEDISGLSGLTTLIPLYEYGLQIFNNPLLSTCNLNVFCNYLSNDPETHPRYIVDNAGNCNNEESIIANCGPLCTAPTNLSATNITTDSATLSWTSDGNLFDIEWGAQGFTQGSGTEVNNVGTTTYNLSGLVANTTYDFYVRQNCTINQSAWVGPFTFITLEEEWSPFSSVTLSGFNHDVIADGSQIPSQTTTTAIDGDTSSTNYVLLNGTYNYNDANPTAYLPSDGYFISAQTPDLPYLPYQLAPANQNNSLRLESGQSGALTFATPTAAKSVYVLATSGGGSSQINVTVHFDDNTTQEFTNYTILDWYSGSANYAIQGIGRVQRNGNDLTAVTIRLFEKQFVLSVANQAKNIVSVSFQRTGGGGIANVMGISIENSIISTCMAPFSLTASDITAEGLTISWGAVNNVNNYQWVLVANGADPNTSSPVSSGNTAQNEVTLSGLEQSTLYDFYVKSDCGVANGTSLWAGPFNFKVGYYNEDIPTQYNDYPSITSTDYCTPEPTITIVVPNGMQIAGLQVVYEMTAMNVGYMSDQRSFIYSPTLALGESTLAEGSENSEGTMTYNRSMDFANGATGTVEFTLRAWRTWGDSGCSTYNNKVDSGTWAIIPTFEPFTACAASTTWIGTSWSNGEPTITTKAIIDGALTLTSDLTACELEVTENGSLTIPANKTFTVKGQVINQATSDDFVIKSDGILLQTDEVENQGAITVERASSPMYRLDYTIWSSPVSGMLLRDLSEVSPSGGSGTLWNRVYILGDSAWNQVWASQQIFEADYTTTFDKAKGYMYRAKNNWVTRDSGNPGESDLGVFTGVPNNGTISINTLLMFNAIGNPYPSPIDGDDLLGAGATGLYFWTNTNTPEADGTYQSNNWAYYNQVGGTGVQIGDVGVPILIPDGIIQPGQGFVAGTTEDVNQITFNNEMRMSTNGSFFRQMSNERHRFWLNLSDEMAVYNQILVGYMENATQDVDAGIDAEMFAYEGNAIYSIIDNNEEKFVIQGRALPFTDADVVKLGFRAIESGSFSISLNNFDGIFEQENLIVYLKDNFNQTQHNLKNGAYSFVSEEGMFENRFEVVYQTTMSTDNPNSTDANWIVYRQDKGFQVQTIGFEMKEVEVYDILGRAVYTSKAEGTTHHIPVLGAEGVFIVKVKTTEDKVLNKKVR